MTGSSAGSERGNYRIEGTALHLMPEAGKETVVSTFSYDDGSKGPARRSVYFGGGMLKRVFQPPHSGQLELLRKCSAGLSHESILYWLNFDS